MILFRSPLYEVEPTSTFRSCCGNNKIAKHAHLRHVTLGKDSCDLCHNNIGGEVAKQIAQCNSALNPILKGSCQLIALFSLFFCYFLNDKPYKSQQHLCTTCSSGRTNLILTLFASLFFFRTVRARSGLRNVDR